MAALAEVAGEQQRLLLGPDLERRALRRPDARVLARRLRRARAQDDAVQDRQPEQRAGSRPRAGRRGTRRGSGAPPWASARRACRGCRAGPRSSPRLPWAKAGSGAKLIARPPGPQGLSPNSNGAWRCVSANFMHLEAHARADRLARRRAQADHAAAVQGAGAAAQADDLGVVVEADVGAVVAEVGELEGAAVPVDPRMRARHAGVVDDVGGLRAAAEDHRQAGRRRRCGSGRARSGGCPRARATAGDHVAERRRRGVAEAAHGSSRCTCTGSTRPRSCIRSRLRKRERSQSPQAVDDARPWPASRCRRHGRAAAPRR